MPLEVVVELQVHAVRLRAARRSGDGRGAVMYPGVFLPEKRHVFLSACILGQHKETGCLPPVYPLLFHEKMCFGKVFERAKDPAAVIEMLESNVTEFKLTHLVSSG